jgi:hypothetical protein
VLVLVDQAVEDGCAVDGVVGEAYGGWWSGLDSGWAGTVALCEARADEIVDPLIPVGQIARASSSKAATTRSVVGSSTPSS